jgi:flavodoxin
MELSLKNYTTTLTKELLKLAEKNIVRECDEIEKGRYVAYVDEGEDSYDVSLVILQNGEIKMADCDCKNNKTFCRHKTALLLFIAGAKKEKKPAKVKTKANKSDALLDDAALHELKDWVKNLLLKNPDIELAFVHHFSAKNNTFTAEEIEKLTNDAVKAVVKNKKNIDPTQLKKIVELWADIHAPIVQQYQAGAAGENMFTCLHVLLNCCMETHTKLGVNSKKIPAYVDSLLKTCVETIAGIYDEQSWSAATGYFITHITDKNRNIRFYYLQHLQNIISLSSGDRKKLLVNEIVNQYSKLKPDNMVYGDTYTQRVFDMVEEQGFFEKYYTVFKPVEWSNAYNEKLIGLLIENKHHSLAEKYCRAQIAGNYREEYNIPYLKLLKQIYAVTGNEKGMADVLTQLFPYTFLFEDYLFITARMNDDEEKKKWRTKILSRARNASRNYSHAAMLFCFALADHEKKYVKMIEYIDGYTRYDIILRYFELMARTDKTRLLQALLGKSDEYNWGSSMESREKDDAVFPELYTTVLKHYTADYLKAAIKKAEHPAWYHRTGRFVNYMKKSLGMS